MPSDDVLHEEIQQPTLLGLLQTGDLGDELAVDEQAFLARDGVDAHQRVDGVDGLFAHQATSQTRMVDHFCRRVDGAQSVQPGCEGWGETPILCIRFCLTLTLIRRA